MKKLSVRWSIWRITVDENILQRYAPAAYAAIEGGATMPEIVDVDIAATIMKHQQELVDERIRHGLPSSQPELLV